MNKIDIKLYKKFLMEKILLVEDKKELKRLVKGYASATERLQEVNELIGSLRITPQKSLFGEDLHKPILQKINKLLGITKN